MNLKQPLLIWFRLIKSSSHKYDDLNVFKVLFSGVTLYGYLVDK